MRRTAIFVIALGILLLGAAAALAGNTWNGYHWADGTDDPHTGSISLELVDHLNEAGQDSYGSIYDAVVDDWDKNTDPKKGPITLATSSSAARPSACDASNKSTPGDSKIHVCNYDYGRNGWLGLARIWISGDGHIEAGVVLMNDSYLLVEGSVYNQRNVWQHVLCQEIGHTLGLGHQGSPKKQSCMNSRFGLTSSSFISPNQHDYDTLVELYGSPDSGSTNTKKCNPKSPKCDSGAGANVHVSPRAGGGWVVTFTVPPGRGTR